MAQKLFTELNFETQFFKLPQSFRTAENTGKRLLIQKLLETPKMIYDEKAMTPAVQEKVEDHKGFLKDILDDYDVAVQEEGEAEKQKRKRLANEFD